MFPTLEVGDFVVACRWKRSLNKSDLVIVDHPEFGRIIKRILAISSAKGVLLKGDNSLSTSTETLGWVDINAVQAKVWLFIKPSKILCAY